jgi:hypothetical protein
VVGWGAEGKEVEGREAVVEAATEVEGAEAAGRVVAATAEEADWEEEGWARHPQAITITRVSVGGSNSATGHTVICSLRIGRFGFGTGAV